MPAIKRELSPTPSPEEQSSPPSTTTPRKKAKYAKSTNSKDGASSSPSSAAKGQTGAKARISPESKSMIAQEIVKLGIVQLNIDQLVEMTGLTSQQIRSQLVNKRQNLRKQLMEMAQAIQ